MLHNKRFVSLAIRMVDAQVKPFNEQFGFFSEETHKAIKEANKCIYEDALKAFNEMPQSDKEELQKKFEDYFYEDEGDIVLKRTAFYV